MNTKPKCECCPPEMCESCLSPCSSRTHVRNRIEKPLKYEADCGIKNCNVFEGHDAAPTPQIRCDKKVAKTNNENQNSLGSPIGLVASNINLATDNKTVGIIQARYAACLKAFARLHLNDEKEWDSTILDGIIQEGLDLYTTSQNRELSIETAAADIYLHPEPGVLREFVSSAFTFHIELMPKFQQLVDSSSTELGAKGDGMELTLADFIPALRSFLRHHKHALLKVGSFYAMIWYSREAYFVFDACGRRLTDFQADKNKGVAMLMCFKSLENVRHLLNNLSGLQATEPLIIRELKLVKVVTPQGSILQRDYSLRTHQYEIVNDDYAYLKSDLHLTLNQRDLLRNRSSLPVAVTAIVVSKIDHPATWDVRMVDRIICFGVSFCQAHGQKCKRFETPDVNEFPATFILGQFHINIEIKDHLYQGIWRCVPDFKHSELAHALTKAFNAQRHKLILQINYQMYAIWKKQEFIYLLDPYRHRVMGRQNGTKMYEEMEKSASVRMFRTFEVFMNVLNQILLDSNRTSPFFLHVVIVKNIQTVQKVKPGHVKQVQEPQRDDYGEILSINEHICFEEAEDLCKTALGEISDYEDDDLKSDVVEIELRTSSSEEDVLEEEAEGGAGEIKEMEDIETSSSGEEGGGHKTNAQGNKRPGKSNAFRSKEARKGGSNKKKKGKGANDHEKNIEDSDIQKSGNDSRSTRPKSTNKEKKIKETVSRNAEKDAEIKIPQESKDEGLKQRKHLEMDKLSKESNKAPKSHNFNKEKIPENQMDKQKVVNQDLDKNKHMDQVETKEKELPKDKHFDKDGKEGKNSNKGENFSKKKDQGNKEKELKQPDNKSLPTKDPSKYESPDKIVAEQHNGESKDTNKENEILNELKSKKHNDGTEADDENEECLEKTTTLCSILNPNRYPGYSKYPTDMAVLGSESGSYVSICKLFQAGFKVADRLLLMTPWANFVVFRCLGQTNTQEKCYYLFDGCTCNFNRFRHFDLSVGTAGLICFEHLHNIIEYIRQLRKSRGNKTKLLSRSADDICQEYCNKNFILRV